MRGELGRQLVGVVQQGTVQAGAGRRHPGHAAGGRQRTTGIVTWGAGKDDSGSDEQLKSALARWFVKAKT
ncbi:MAG TPA: hypothetical protein VGH27_18170 [Streptosporangiaceae bacterium]